MQVLQVLVAQDRHQGGRRNGTDETSVAIAHGERGDPRTDRRACRILAVGIGHDDMTVRRLRQRRHRRRSRSAEEICDRRHSGQSAVIGDHEDMRCIVVAATRQHLAHVPRMALRPRRGNRRDEIARDGLGMRGNRCRHSCRHVNAGGHIDQAPHTATRARGRARPAAAASPAAGRSAPRAIQTMPATTSRRSVRNVRARCRNRRSGRRAGGSRHDSAARDGRAPTRCRHCDRHW